MSENKVMEKFCYDCGNTPVWYWASNNDYCRKCNEKNGNLYESQIPIDPDLLEQKVGRDLTEQILNGCRSK